MPRVPGADEYGQGGGDFGTLESDEYRLKILSWEEHEQPLNQYNKDPNAKSIWFKLEPLHYEHDPEAELVDKDTGEPISPDKTLIFFYDPKRLGLVPRIARSRMFLAAALNVPVEEPIDFDGYDDLIGKEIVGNVIVKDGKNRIDSVRPVKQRAKRSTTKEAPAVKAAKEVFGEDANEPEDDTDY